MSKSVKESLQEENGWLSAVGLENYFSEGCSSGNIPIDTGPTHCIKGPFVKASHSSLLSLK